MCECLAWGHFPVAWSGPSSSAGQPAVPRRGQAELNSAWYGSRNAGHSAAAASLPEFSCSLPRMEEERLRSSHTERECRFCEGMGSSGWWPLPSSAPTRQGGAAECVGLGLDLGLNPNSTYGLCSRGPTYHLTVSNTCLRTVLLINSYKVLSTAPGHSVFRD